MALATGVSHFWRHSASYPVTELKVGPETGLLAPFRFKLKTKTTAPELCSVVINWSFHNPKRQ